MTAIRAEKICKRFGKTEALTNVSFSCTDGEFVSILGAPGAGKSTLLKILAGLYDCDGGAVFFDGEDMAEVDARNRNVSMAFESYALYPHLNVRENILHPLKVRGGYSQAEMESMLQEVTEMLRITELMDRKTSQLSGGQRQRVGLARALIRKDARVLFLDEPIAHLDAALRIWLRGELKRYLKARGITTLYATPDYLEAMTMGDQVVVLSKGRVIQNSDPRMLIEQPQNVELAGLIGDPPINVLTEKIDYSTEKPCINLGGMSIIVPDAWNEYLSDKKPDYVKIGIRPADVVLYKESADNLIKGKIYIQEGMQRKQVTSVIIDDRMIKVNTPLDSDYNIDTDIWVGLNLEKTLLFDNDTEMLVGLASK